MILGSNFILKAFIFKKDHITKISQSSKKLIHKFHSKIYKFCVKLKVDLWEVFMIEVGPKLTEVDLLVLFAHFYDQNDSRALGFFAFQRRGLVFSAPVGSFFGASEKYKRNRAGQNL